jgi:hypothetical protein
MKRTSRLNGPFMNRTQAGTGADSARDTLATTRLSSARAAALRPIMSA